MFFNDGDAGLDGSKQSHGSNESIKGADYLFLVFFWSIFYGMLKVFDRRMVLTGD